MALSRRKRALLVRHIGEDQVAAIEKGLKDKEAELMRAGVAFKEVGVVVGVTAPLAGATSFDEADEYDEARGVEDFARRLESRFDLIVDNIFASDATLAEKTNKVKAAAAEMEKRLGKSPEPDNFFGRVKAMSVLDRSGGAKVPDSPGGRALGQIAVLSRGNGSSASGKDLPDTPGGRALKQIGGV